MSALLKFIPGFYHRFDCVSSMSHEFLTKRKEKEQSYWKDGRREFAIGIRWQLSKGLTEGRLTRREAHRGMEVRVVRSEVEQID